MKKQKALALLLALTTTAGCLAGCGNTADTDAAKDSSQATTEVSSTESDTPSSEAEEFDPRSVCDGVVLTIAVADQQEVIDYNTNEMTLRIEEELYVGSIVDTLDWIPKEHVTRLPMTAEEVEITSEIQVTLNNYVRESIGSFLTGQWDIDADWDTYIGELQKIGYEEALEIYQTAYDRTK